ncbi:MAG: hypothetical protein IT342_14850 [Candidatus Melainabacteria bacterium]|nr:hypothetical protein [Candidatus Melainabacteria bacterium]
MIRIGKPVQLLEWGQGTNTTNQNWTKFAEGTIEGKPRCVDGVTNVIIAIEGKLHKKNGADDYVKIMQQGEGMTPASQKWGEVAMGTLSSVDDSSGKTLLNIALRGATKLGKLVK